MLANLASPTPLRQNLDLIQVDPAHKRLKNDLKCPYLAISACMTSINYFLVEFPLIKVHVLVASPIPTSEAKFKLPLPPEIF